MRINKLLNAVKNIDKVYEGIKNNVFKKSYIEDIANYRWQQCKTCVHLDIKGDKCAMPGSKPCCAECGCSLAFKTRSVAAECPLKGDDKKWEQVMEADQEQVLLTNLQKKDDHDNKRES